MPPITPDLLTGVACGQWDGHRHQATSYVYVCIYIFIIIILFLLLYLRVTIFFWVNLRPFVQNMHLSEKKNVFLPFFSTFQENSFFATFGVFKLLGQNHRVEALVGGKSYLDVPLFANRSKHKNVGFDS